MNSPRIIRVILTLAALSASLTAQTVTPDTNLSGDEIASRFLALISLDSPTATMMTGEWLTSTCGFLESLLRSWRDRHQSPNWVVKPGRTMRSLRSVNSTCSGWRKSKATCEAAW